MKYYKTILIILTFGFIACKGNSTNSKLNDSLKSHAIASNASKLDTSSGRDKNPISYPLKYELKNDSLTIDLMINNRNSSHSKFELSVLINGKVQKISSEAKLILIEDSNGSLIVPEGTSILDKITQKEYICDSTFMYTSKDINISFAPEVKTGKRLSLVLYNSKIAGVSNNEYTLYKND